MHKLLDIIRERQSSRTPFDPELPVSRYDMLQILEAASWAPTAHNMQNYEVMLVDDRKKIEAIRNIRLHTSATFIRENYLQLSFSEEELKEKKTGVLGTMFPKSWLHPETASTDTDERDEEHPLLERHEQMLKCPALVIVLYDKSKRAPASEGDFLGIMSIGCVLENMWLMATSLGVGFHVVSSLSGEEVEREIKRILDIPDHLSIAISFRLGYPMASAKYLRVRRNINDFTHHNGFGNKTYEDI